MELLHYKDISGSGNPTGVSKLTRQSRNYILFQKEKTTAEAPSQWQKNFLENNSYLPRGGLRQRLGSVRFDKPKTRHLERTFNWMIVRYQLT